MQIDLDVRDRATPFVSAFFARHMPFVTATALNETAKDFQAVQRTRMHQIFTLRRPQFAERAIKISPFATRKRQEVRISVDPTPAGPENDDIFTKFEIDRTKRPFRGRSIAVPTSHVPRTAAGIIRRGWQPNDLFKEAKQHGVGRVFKRKGNVYRGGRRTFLIRRPGGRGTIFLRDDEGLVPLYQLVPLVRIRPELEFVRHGKAAVATQWAPNFTAAFDRAMRTAR